MFGSFEGKNQTLASVRQDTVGMGHTGKLLRKAYVKSESAASESSQSGRDADGRTGSRLAVWISSSAS
jgi:hypothetical protein